MTGAPSGRALGLDLGTRRIGVALTDDERTLATPLEVVDRADIDAAHRRIRQLVEDWGISVVVVGLPLHLSGATGRSVEFVESEIERLGDTIDVPLVTYDERLSTVTADRTLAEQGLDSRSRRHVVDMVAAAVILQGWIDQER